MTASPTTPSPVQRDLRLDFFRGAALIFIFIDHIPGNKLAYVTLGSWNYCDAAEMFVFISGYTAALVFGGVLLRAGPVLAGLRILTRCWVLYVAHVFMFVAFMAQVSLTAERLMNPMFLEETRVDEFLKTPHLAVAHTLTLTFQPAFMDILPLYIALMLGLIPALPLIARWPWATLGLSFGLWLATHIFALNLGTYPDGTWFFSPMGWQFLFVIGACLGFPRPQPWRPWLDWRPLPWLCAAVLALCAGAKLFLWEQYTYNFEWSWLSRALYWGPGGSKTALGLYRLVNFLALAYLAAHLVKPDAAWLRAAAAKPVIWMGENSLYIFCLGIFLSYLGHLVLVEYSSRSIVHIAVSAIGVGLMAGVAATMTWVRRAERPRRSVGASRAA
ncbi:MAG: OpgC domain-containing protein [Alphaproteobacteria bacterium]|nr:OpgC domain-containing protein [Alphaproteobacteria bacterium]